MIPWITFIITLQQDCNTQPCPYFGKWGNWEDCSTTCGKGTRDRKRQCFEGDIGNVGCDKGGEIEKDVCIHFCIFVYCIKKIWQYFFYQLCRIVTKDHVRNGANGQTGESVLRHVAKVNQHGPECVSIAKIRLTVLGHQQLRKHATTESVPVSGQFGQRGRDAHPLAGSLRKTENVNV